MIDCFHREGASFSFHEFHDGVGRKSLADILYHILHHTVEQVEVRNIVPLGDVTSDNCMCVPKRNKESGYYLKNLQFSIDD